MRRSRKIFCGLVFGLMVAANATTASAATQDPPVDYPFRECIEQTASWFHDAGIKIGRFAKRTGMEIGKQSKRLGETFRDGGKEIWAAATKDDEH